MNYNKICPVAILKSLTPTKISATTFSIHGLICIAEMQDGLHCHRSIDMPEPQIYIPTRDEIEALKEGDLAPDCFGNWRRVTRISARGDDVNGKAYICYYTEFGPGASISNSLKEGVINRTVALTGKFTSHELDILEKSLCAGTR
jgi:hypothetical protein